LYGEIAADAGKRQTFANNVVHFMKQYGAWTIARRSKDAPWVT
jgi:hypothetical protein